MPDVRTRILDALAMAGLSPSEITAVKGGTPIYGDAGIVDSLGLVRLVSAVSSSFEDLGVDMFDLLLEFDLEAASAFATLPAIEGFLSRTLGSPAAESVA